MHNNSTNNIDLVQVLTSTGIFNSDDAKRFATAQVEILLEQMLTRRALRSESVDSARSLLQCILSKVNKRKKMQAIHELLTLIRCNLGHRISKAGMAVRHERNLFKPCLVTVIADK